VMRREGFAGIPRPSIEFGYLVRTYRPGDDRFWHAIVERNFDGNWSVERFRKEIIETRQFDPRGLIFVTFGSRPAGTVCAWRSGPAERHVGTLRMMAVKPEHRGKEIGRFLTVKALEYFRDSGFSSVELSLDDSWLAAIKIYLASGFRPILTHESHSPRWEEVFRRLALPDRRT